MCLGMVEIFDVVVCEGVDVVGGIDLMMFDGDVDGQFDIVFGIVEKCGVKIDIYLYELGEVGIV